MRLQEHPVRLFVFDHERRRFIHSPSQAFTFFYPDSIDEGYDLRAKIEAQLIAARIFWAPLITQQDFGLPTIYRANGTPFLWLWMVRLTIGGPAHILIQRKAQYFTIEGFKTCGSFNDVERMRDSLLKGGKRIAPDFVRSALNTRSLGRKPADNTAPSQPNAKGSD